MIDHTPVLVIALPILAAIVPTMLGILFEDVGWPVAVVAMGAQTVIAGALAMTVFSDGSLSYEVGGFAAPYGIELVVDAFSAIVVLLIATVGLAVLSYGRTAGPRSNSFYSMYLLLIAGLSGMTVTGDVFNLYVFLEITGLATYGLVAAGRSASAAVAALKYLILGTIGASLYLLGVGYAFIATGTLNMTDLATKLGAVGDLGYQSPLVLTAFGLIVTGLAVKIALFPLHTWQPGAYSNSPDTVSTLISALVSTVAAYALARVIFSVFTVDFFDAVPVARDALVAVAGVSIVAGSVLAVSQTDVQRMLAYSSVSQFGLVVIGFAIASPIAVVGATVHLVGHAVMKGGLFAATGIVRRKTGAETVDEYLHLGERSPLVAACFAVLAFALVGVPPAVGFVGKWYIVIGAVEAQLWPVVVVVLISTLLTLAYFVRIVERMYFTEPGQESGETPSPRPEEERSGENRSVEDEFVDNGSGAEHPLTRCGDAPVSPGMIALIVVATVTAIALGFAVPALQSVLEPTITEVLGV